MSVISPERLRQLRPFAALGQPLLERLAAAMHLLHCPAGATVFAQYDTSREVYVVLHGHLRTIAYSRAGREVVLHDRYAGDIIGKLGAFDGTPRGGNLVAVSDCELGRIDAATFNQLLREEPEFALIVIARLTRLVRSLTNRVQILAVPVPTRVCAALLALAERQRVGENAARLIPAPKHQDLANRVNTHREAVSRTLGALQRRGVILRGKGELLVHDLAALRALAQGEPLEAGPPGDISARLAEAARQKR